MKSLIITDNSGEEVHIYPPNFWKTNKLLSDLDIQFSLRDSGTARIPKMLKTHITKMQEVGSWGFQLFQSSMIRSNDQTGGFGSFDMEWNECIFHYRFFLYTIVYSSVKSLVNK